MVSSNGKIPSADGVFFNEGADFNQGRIYDFNEDEFIAACEKAIERVESSEENLNGLKLQKEFTYEKMVDQILGSLHA